MNSERGRLVIFSGKKETVRRKLKTTPTDILKKKFKVLRSKVKRMITESRGPFFENISEALSNIQKDSGLSLKSAVNVPVYQET